MLSGSVTVLDLTTAVDVHVARTAPAECGGARLEELRTAIRRAADVLADGKQDSVRVCDAVSLGIGFDAERIDVRGVAPAVAAPGSSCP